MNYIVFDLEATCWENDRTKPNEIIEIGAVKINDKLEVVDEFQIFIKPKLNPILSDFCKQLTSIKQEDVDKAKQFYQAVYSFKNWIGNEDYILCSWGEYDKKQLTKDCKLHNHEISWLNKHTSLKHQYINYSGVGKRRAGMGAVLRQLGIPLEGTHHRGIDDAKNIAKIFIKEFDKWNFNI